MNTAISSYFIKVLLIINVSECKNAKKSFWFFLVLFKLRGIVKVILNRADSLENFGVYIWEKLDII